MDDIVGKVTRGEFGKQFYLFFSVKVILRSIRGEILDGDILAAYSH